MEFKKIKILILLAIFCFSVSGFVFAQANIPACPSLAIGSTGSCVTFLQQSLNTLISAGLAVDGIFGPSTQSAVRAYQIQKGITVDGVVGAQTWSAISQDLSGQSYSLPPLPPGTGLTTPRVLGLLIQFANFLIAAGIILAIITIVVSGIMYLKAGGTEANITKAKGWFKNGLIGAFIILAVGVIILTIYNLSLIHI